MWIVIVVVAILIVIVFCFLRSEKSIMYSFVLEEQKRANRKKEEEYGSEFAPGVNDDTIYFRVTGKNGTKSCIHDSGVKVNHLTLEQKKHIQIPILKTEYNDTKEVSIEEPNLIEYGQQIRNLNKILPIEPSNLIDKGNYFIVTIAL